MDYTVLDLEMTGLAPKRDKVIEIGAVRVRNGEIADTYGTLVRPGMSIPETVVQLTGITDEMAALGKEENVAMQELLQFIGDVILVGHNLIFDYSFLKQWAVNQKIPLELSACDTLRIARALLPGAQSKKLESLCEYFQIEREHVFLEIMERSGRREPYLQGGISNYLGYRNFSLSFNLTYSLGNKIRLLKLCTEYGTTNPNPHSNLRREFVNRWRKPGDEEHTNIPGLNTVAGMSHIELQTIFMRCMTIRISGW